MVGSLGRPLRQVCFPLNKVVLTLYGISVLISLGLAAVLHLETTMLIISTK